MTVQLFMISVQFLWVYDYLLTLGDEVQYFRGFPEVSGSDQ